MKKIVSIFFVTTILLGCSYNSNSQENTLIPTVEETPFPTNENNFIVPSGTKWYQLFSDNNTNDSIIEIFRKNYKIHISLILVSEDNTKIGLGTELGPFEGTEFFPTKEDFEYKLMYEDGGYITNVMYLGDLEMISENIYKSNGEFIPSRKKYENLYHDEVDFYVIFDEYNLYIIPDHPDIINPEQMSKEDFINLSENSFFINYHYYRYYHPIGS